jgi:hypothetical protein
MAGVLSCEACGGASRRIWHCREDFGPLRQVLLGNKVELLACPACGSLWCYAHLGDEPAQPVAIPWKYGAEDWQKTYDLDDGVSLKKWFRRQVRAISLVVDHPCGRQVCRFRTHRPKPPSL